MNIYYCHHYLSGSDRWKILLCIAYLTIIYNNWWVHSIVDANPMNEFIVRLHSDDAGIHIICLQISFSSSCSDSQKYINSFSSGPWRARWILTKIPMTFLCGTTRNWYFVFFSRHLIVLVCLIIRKYENINTKVSCEFQFVVDGCWWLMLWRHRMISI